MADSLLGGRQGRGGMNTLLAFNSTRSLPTPPAFRDDETRRAERLAKKAERKARKRMRKNG